jgi:hypothetical protein
MYILSALLHLLVVNARQYSIVKEHHIRNLLVGLGRIELPTSPLSGVRSSQLSYRPEWAFESWWSWSGSNRRPPECKSGALPAELQPLVRKSIEADWTRGQGGQLLNPYLLP